MSEYERVTSPRRVLGTSELSLAIGKSETTIRTYITKAEYAHLLPPGFKPPGSYRWFWFEDVVNEWLQRCEACGQPYRQLGRPTKRQSLAKARAVAKGQQPRQSE